MVWGRSNSLANLVKNRDREERITPHFNDLPEMSVLN
jgi:hypothetical protein